MGRFRGCAVFTLAALAAIASIASGAADGPAAPAQAPRASAPRQAEVDAAVALALEWFLAQQRPDGSWTLDTGPSRKTARPHLGATALGVLALLHGSPNPREGKHHAALVKALEVLVAAPRIKSKGDDNVDPNADPSVDPNTDPNDPNALPKPPAPEGEDDEPKLRMQLSAGKSGDLTGDEGSLLSQALALEALIEARSVLNDERLKPVIESGVAFAIAKQRMPEGTWGAAEGLPGKMRVTAWHLAALRTASQTSIETPRRPVAGTIAFLNSAGLKSGGFAESLPARSADPCSTAAGYWMRLLSGWGPRHPALAKGLDELVQAGPAPQDPLRNYFATQAVFLASGPRWDRWNATLRDLLLATQSKRGTAESHRGSWFTPGPYGLEESARLVETAESVLMLRTRERYAALYPDAEKLTELPWVEAIRAARSESSWVYKPSYKANSPGWSFQRDPIIWQRSLSYMKSPSGEVWFRGLGREQSGTSYATAISSDGRTVVGHSIVKGRSKGVAWRIGKEIETHLLEGPAVSKLIGVSADGLVLAGNIDVSHAFVYTERSGLKELGYLPGESKSRYETERSSEAQFVSADGKWIAGISSSLEGLQPFRWSEGEGMQPMGMAPGGLAHGILSGTPDGQTFLVWSAGASYELFRWNPTDKYAKVAITLGSDQGSRSVTAAGMSADGKTIFLPRGAFLGTFGVQLNARGEDWVGQLAEQNYFGLPCTSSFDGRILAGSRVLRGKVISFVWTAKGGTLLLPDWLRQNGVDLSKWQNVRIQRITPDGLYAVGEGDAPSGAREAWVARLPQP